MPGNNETSRTEVTAEQTVEQAAERAFLLALAKATNAAVREAQKLQPPALPQAFRDAAKASNYRIFANPALNSKGKLQLDKLEDLENTLPCP